MKVKNLNSHLEHIVSGYSQQSQFYKQILESAEKMEKLVRTGEVAGLDEIFQQREKIIKAIKEIDAQILLHKQVVMELLHLKEFKLDRVEDLIYPQIRSQFQDQINTVQDIIKRIMAKDKVIEEGIMKLRSSMTKEIKDIKQHFQFQKTYLDRPEDFPEPRFFDQKK